METTAGKFAARQDNVYGWQCARWVEESAGCQKYGVLLMGDSTDRMVVEAVCPDRAMRSYFADADDEANVNRAFACHLPGLDIGMYPIWGILQNGALSSPRCQTICTPCCSRFGVESEPPTQACVRTPRLSSCVWTRTTAAAQASKLAGWQGRTRRACGPPPATALRGHLNCLCNISDGQCPPPPPCSS